MTKNVLVTITSRHTHDGEDESIQSVSPGTYSYIQDRHVVCFEEIVEEAVNATVSNTRCILKAGFDDISLTQHGLTNTVMYFKQGESFDGIYHTPAGSLQMCLRTSRLSIVESWDTISINLEYGLELNHSHVSNCHMNIDITAQMDA